MSYAATILADSISPHGHRLTTFEVTFPRIVLAEFNTHRMLSRNSASSRAIPVEKIIQRVKDDPFVPANFGKNQSGMQEGEALGAGQQFICKEYWLKARDQAIAVAESLREIGVHKQLTNRLLEPFMWQTVICTATELSNFFALRCHPAAQPEIYTIAVMMKEAYARSLPRDMGYTDWHLPLVPDFDDLIQTYHIEDIKRISAGRCCRVSYLTHHGVRDPQADIQLCLDLVRDGHMSPMEHIAHPTLDRGFTGNLRGWASVRTAIPNEHDYSLRVAG